MNEGGGRLQNQLQRYNKFLIREKDFSLIFLEFFLKVGKGVIFSFFGGELRGWGSYGEFYKFTVMLEI